MHKLTKKFIDSLNPPSAGYEIKWDGELKGFGVRITSKGIITFIIDYRNKNGRRRRMSIGRYGVLTPAQARGKAIEILASVNAGKDPLESKKKMRAESTFKDLANEYIKRHASQKRSRKEDERIINKELIPKWGHLPIKEIRRRDVIRLIDAINDRGAPIMANRTLALIKTIFNFGISRDIIEFNPAHLVKPPAKEKPRDRVLSESEIKKFWDRIDKIPTLSIHIKAVLKLILITAQRPGEITNMEWKELDLETGWWTIPAEKTKNKLSHRVPLSPLAKKIIQSIPRESERFVFPGRKGSQFLKDKPIQANSIAHAVRDNRKDLDVDFRPHDLRRTAASQMTSMGISRLVVSKILNHVETGVTAVYDRNSYDREKRDALNAWSERLLNIIEGKKAEVIPLTR